MSQVTVTKCDHCGCEIKRSDIGIPNGTRIDISENFHSAGYGVSDFTGSYDLCPDCTERYRQVLRALLTGFVLRCPYCEPQDGKEAEPLRDDEYDYAYVNAEGRQISLTHFFDEQGRTSFDTFVDIKRCPMCGRKL